MGKKGHKKGHSSALKTVVDIALVGGAIGIALSSAHAPPHSSHHHTQSLTARRREADERRAREEAARIRQEEDARRERNRLQQEALAHEQTLQDYPNLASEALQKLRPLTNHQNHTPPSLSGKTLPYLLLSDHNIDGFVCLIHEKNYQVHLPKFGEYNPLKWISHNSEAVSILKKIQRHFTPDAYEFLAHEAYTQFDMPHSPCDSILIWLLENDKLPSTIAASLNSKIATAMQTHFELYCLLFLKNGQFLRQSAPIRTLFLTQLLTINAHHQDALSLTLNDLYAQKLNAWQEQKTIDIGLLFDDLISTHLQTQTTALSLIHNICQRNRSIAVTFSKSFWRGFLLNNDTRTVRQFVDLTLNKLGTTSVTNHISEITAITLSTIADKNACATILEPWLPIIANSNTTLSSLISIAMLVCDTNFEFVCQLLSFSSQLLESKAARLMFLSQLFKTTEGKTKTLQIQKWYFKNEQYYAEHLFEDLRAIQETTYALKFIKSVATGKAKFAAYSEGFLTRLVYPQAPLEECIQLNECIDTLYPTFSIENKRTLQRLILQGLVDNSEQALLLVDWHLTSNKSLFEQYAFMIKSDSIRIGMLKRLFATFQGDHEKIKSYLREWYQGKLFRLKEMNLDLQIIGQQDLVPSIIRDLANTMTCSMDISPELFSVIDPLGLGTSDLIESLARLPDKKAIRSFLHIAPSLEYKIALICRHQEAFSAEDFCQIFRRFILKEQVHDQYRYIESYVLQQQRTINEESSPNIANIQPSAPPMEEYYPEAVLVQPSTHQQSSAYAYAVAVPMEEPSFEPQDIAHKKEVNDHIFSPKQDLPRPSIVQQERAQITQKILLAFIKVSFEKMSAANNIIQVARQLKGEWLEHHFVPHYIDIMYEWAKMSILFFEIGREVDPHHRDIARFMEETGTPAEPSWYNSFSPILSKTGFFSSAKARIYQTIHTNQQTNKDIGKMPDLVKELLEIEEQFTKVFRLV